MKTKRYIAINNCLVQGICNCNCITCGVNKKSYTGIKEYQSEHITMKIIERIKEAALQGVHIRYIVNSGEGEPTLHPEFARRMDMFGELIKNWPQKYGLPPEIGIVTNGLKLHGKDIFESLVRNRISVKISFPSADTLHYGEIMIQEPKAGTELFNVLIPNIEKAMRLASKGELKRLEFHISPPLYEFVYFDFSKTIEYLLLLARKTNLKKLELVIFPAFSNRAGLLKKATNRVEMFRKYFKKYNNTKREDVNIVMTNVLHKFYGNLNDIMDLYISFNFPCIWYGNINISSNGYVYCSNDQNMLETRGNVCENTIKEIMEMKEIMLPTKLCSGCNQSPDRLHGSILLNLFSLMTKIKMGLLKVKEDRRIPQ